MKTPAITYRRRALTLMEMLLSVALIGVLAALLLPAVRSAYANSRKAACLSNLRTLSVIFHQYAAEQNGRVRFLRDGTGSPMWYTALQKQAGLSDTEAQNAFGCPLTRRQDTGAWNCYGMRLGYLTARIADDPGIIDRPDGNGYYQFAISRVPVLSQFLLMADSATASGKQNFRIGGRQLYNGGGVCLRHQGMGNALFLDGHVESLTASGFAPLGITELLDEAFRVVTP